MFGMSMSALGARMVMMMHCHHLSLTMMCCHLIGISPIEPSLADEILKAWSVSLNIWEVELSNHLHPHHSLTHCYHRNQQYQKFVCLSVCDKL